MKETGTGIAFGKVILTGEHSVVYGNPAVAIPFRGAKASTRINTAESLTLNTIYYSGNIDMVPKSLQGIRSLIYHVLETLGKKSIHLEIHIDSTIPLHRGLGSSAAVSISVVRALYDFFEIPLSDSQLRNHVEVAERIHHSNPSGLDMETIIHNSPIYFIKNQMCNPLSINLEGWIVVADTGLLGNTSDAVNHFAHIINQNKKKVILNDFKNITESIISASKERNYHLVGRLLTQNHELLKHCGVSTPMLDAFVETALQQGAYGAKLTGSGMGGCMFAYCDTEEHAESIKQALIDAGAQATYSFNLEESV